MGINVQKIVTAFNPVIARRRDKIYSQYMEQITSPLFKYCSPKGGIQANQKYVGSNVLLGEVLQAWQKGSVAKGDAKFIPAEIMQRRHEILTNFAPDDLYGTILGFMRDERQKPTDVDIVNYMIDLLLSRSAEDLIYEQLYWGTYVAPTNGVASPAKEAVNGFGKLIELGLENPDDDQKMNGIDIGGGLVIGNEYEQIGDFVKQIHPKYRFRPMLAFISEDHAEGYWTQREEEIGTHVNTRDGNPYRVPGTQITLVPEPSMIGSDRIFVTPQWNLTRIFDQMSELSKLRANQYEPKVVTIEGDYNQAFGFEFNKFVWANNLSESGSGGGDEEEEPVFVD